MPGRRGAHYEPCGSRAAPALRPACPGCNMLSRTVPSPVSPSGPPLAPPPSDSGPGAPLSVDELLAVLRGRWQASYDLQLIVRRGRLYLQVMWGYLEQQSFPMSAEAYGAHLEELVATLNGLGVAEQVRQWLRSTRDRPRLGRALSLPLELPPGRSSEFLL
jgi:hypothetical protein